MMTIADLVARNSRQCPDQIAFVEVRPVSKRAERNELGAL